MKLPVLVLTLLSITTAFFPGESVGGELAGNGVSCTENNGIIEVQFPDAVIPTNFTVLRPDQGMVFISGENAGNLGVQGTRIGTLRIDPRHQQGLQFTDDGSKQPRLVFDDPGTYTLLFSNPGEVKSSTLGSSCKVNISAAGSMTVVTSTTKNIGCSLEERIRVDCLASDGCQEGGHGYCCSHSNIPQSPCYCNNCCVALTQETAAIEE